MYEITHKNSKQSHRKCLTNFRSYCFALMLSTQSACGRSCIFHTPGTLLTIQYEASPPAHQCRVGSSHSRCISLGTWSYCSRGGPSPCHCYHA